MGDEQLAKRRKLIKRRNNAANISISNAVNNPYSILVDEEIWTKEVKVFNVKKRSVFLETLKARKEVQTIFSDFTFENISKSAAKEYRLLNWELRLGSVAYVCIYYGIKLEEEDDLVANCQLQFLSKGKVERESTIVTEDKATEYETNDPTKHQCLSYQFRLKDFWVETTDQIRVILTFASPIELVPPVEDVDGNEAYVPSLEDSFLSDDFSDISVSSKDKKWPAHKIVLAHCSEVFKLRLQTEERNIQLDEFDPRAVMEMLRYAYTGELEAIPEISMDIFKLADKYKIKGLKGQILPMIVNSIKFETAPEMYSFGEHYVLKVVMDRALSIAKDKKKILVKDDKIFKTLAETHPTFMYKLCIHD